ncbi:radical SAM protein [Thermodesulfobacteriota bacterium]
MATLKQKAMLLKGLLTGNTAGTGPLYVDLDLTNNCNLQCIGCPYHSPLVNSDFPHKSNIKNISLNLVANLCRQLKEMGTHTIILQGEGEPTLHPEFGRIVSICKENGLNVVVLTNGTMLDEERIHEIVKLDIDILKITFWAVTDETFELNYPGTRPETLQKMMTGVRLLSRIKNEQRAKRPSIWLHHPVNPYNFKEVPAFIEFALEIQCQQMTLAPFWAPGGALSEFNLTDDQKMKCIQLLTDLKHKIRDPEMLDTLNSALVRFKKGSSFLSELPCYIGWYHLRIRTDGDVQPCGRCQLKLGNLNDHSLADIWRSKESRDFRRRSATLEGLRSLSGSCDCNMCCYIHDNERIHRHFKWLAPFSYSAKSKTAGFHNA